MENSTEIMSFVLGPYRDIGELRYLYFSITLLWYLLICTANTLLILVIYVDKRLHEPMYILAGHLFVSELSGSTALYPLMLSQMLSDTHEVTLPWCYLQMGFLYTCASVEFCSLAAMAYDRYVAICCPLHYSVIMNTGKVATIILVVWVYSFVNFAMSFAVVIDLRFCGNVIEKVFCDQYLIIRLACSVTLINQIADLLFAFVTIVLPSSLISVSYMKIIAVCLKTSKENRQKAFSTCSPQIISLSNLFLSTLFHFIESRLHATYVPDKVRAFLSVYILLCQPIITPFLYGFKLPKIRQSCERFLYD